MLSRAQLEYIAVHAQLNAMYNDDYEYREIIKNFSVKAGYDGSYIPCIITNAIVYMFEKHITIDDIEIE